MEERWEVAEWFALANGHLGNTAPVHVLASAPSSAVAPARADAERRRARLGVVPAPAAPPPR